MPSAMMHLLCAKEFKKDATTEFYFGAIAPDCIRGREEKDLLHLRTLKGQERYEALLKTARELKAGDNFALGCLLHLFTDYEWDNSYLADYIKNNTEEGWFLSYRYEINLITSHLYRSLPWAKELWDEMYALDMTRVSTLEWYTPELLSAFLDRNYLWHKENVIGPSKVFPYETAIAFCKQTSAKFKEFLQSLD